jgi:hypothetical protein
MKFEYTHYEVTKQQPLEKIEVYLKSIGAIPDTRWEAEVKKEGWTPWYVVLYTTGEYEPTNHDGNAPESFIPKT